jgi:hypothetical protein
MCDVRNYTSNIYRYCVIWRYKVCVRFLVNINFVLGIYYGVRVCVLGLFRTNPTGNLGRHYDGYAITRHLLVNEIDIKRGIERVQGAWPVAVNQSTEYIENNRSLCVVHVLCTNPDQSVM